MPDLQRRDAELDDTVRRQHAAPGGARDSADRATGGAGSSPADMIAHLQHAAGNAGVASLLSGEETSPVAGLIGRGGGEPLDRSTRSEMEASFGTDFSSVRVHRGSEASASAQAVGARAYTVGPEIVLSDGADDRRTIAHELTHVVQQAAGPVDGHPAAGGIQVSDPGDRFEQAAEATADHVLAGGSVSEPGATGSSAPTAQRATDDDEVDEDGFSAQRLAIQRDADDHADPTSAPSRRTRTDT